VDVLYSDWNVPVHMFLYYVIIEDQFKCKVAPLPTHYDIESIEGLEMKLNAVLTSASCSGRFSRCTHWIGGRVRPRTSLHMIVKTNSLALLALEPLVSIP